MTANEIYIGLFSAGILGSLHCIGMCGPLALSLPVSTGATRWGVVRSRTVYHSGRILSYMAIGLVFGSIGSLLSLAGLQQVLSITAGALILGYALLKMPGLNLRFRPGQRFSTFISGALNRAFKQDRWFTMFLAGSLNGLLPCGMVYMAAGMTVAFGSMADASFGMALFGLGTFPVMFIMSLGTSLFPSRVRLKVNRYSMIFALVIGVLFVLRGLNLDIKYISPKVSQQQGVECCEPMKH